jgi:hypothetical protein
MGVLALDELNNEPSTFSLIVGLYLEELLLDPPEELFLEIFACIANLSLTVN